jgi:hypothetical protein
MARRRKVAKCSEQDNGKDNGRKGEGNCCRRDESTVLTDIIEPSKREAHDRR